MNMAEREEEEQRAEVNLEAELWRTERERRLFPDFQSLFDGTMLDVYAQLHQDFVEGVDPNAVRRTIRANQSNLRLLRRWQRQLEHLVDRTLLKSETI
jgi:hypothetical protein